MLVNSLVDQYLSTHDSDLKYMTLRQEFRVQTVEDLQLLIDKVLLPVLLGECNSEIVNLVSFQVFPDAVLKLISSGELVNRRNQPAWFDNSIVLPLIEKNANNRANFLKQTLRNILKKIILNLNPAFLPTGRDESSIKTLLNHMTKIKSSNDIGANYVIDWEILDLMIQLYYYGDFKMSNEVLKSVLILCPNEGDLIETMKTVLTKSIEVTSRKVLCDSEIKQLIGNPGVLEVISDVWYQLQYVVTSIFTEDLLPFFQALNKHDDVLLKVLRSIYNLHPFYSLKRMSSGSTYLDSNIITKLQKLLLDLKTECELEPVNNALTASPDVLEAETDADPGQQAYLEELRDDDESFELEEDNYLELEEDSIDDKIFNLCDMILKKTESNPAAPKSDALELHTAEEDLKAIQLHGHTTQAETGAFESVKSALASSTSLSSLQLAVEVLDQIMFNSPNFNFSETCILLIPHMKQNKSFINTIKVGNMTQTIDEGLTLRTMVYSTLLQIVTHKESSKPLDYYGVCSLLKETAFRGIKDPDHTINVLSLKIMQSLLEENYNTIRGVDSQWYNDVVHQKAVENIKKSYQRLQVLETTTDTSSAGTVLHQFESLLIECYPAMQ